MIDLIKLVSLMKGELSGVDIKIPVKQYKDVKITASIRVSSNGNYRVYVYVDCKHTIHKEWSYKHRQHLIDSITERLEKCLADIKSEVAQD